MVLTVPVLAWPGRDFLTGAFAAPRVRRLTMDVPVALGLSVAFLGSVRATITGEGEVWLDSVVMLVTLLCIARYLELLARRRATATVRALVRSVPLVATRIGGGAATRGPPDGVIRSGTAEVSPGRTATGRKPKSASRTRTAAGTRWRMSSRRPAVSPGGSAASVTQSAVRTSSPVSMRRRCGIRPAGRMA